MAALTRSRRGHGPPQVVRDQLESAAASTSPPPSA